ncbi:MAG: hypothetical protein OEV64_10410 [Desulfobulbaceae bacterium]|nr:hypothetical protein [Desulfobulbaceae bacterium]
MRPNDNRTFYAADISIYVLVIVSPVLQIRANLSRSGFAMRLEEMERSYYL